MLSAAVKPSPSRRHQPVHFYPNITISQWKKGQSNDQGSRQILKDEKLKIIAAPKPESTLISFSLEILFISTMSGLNSQRGISNKYTQSPPPLPPTHTSLDHFPTPTPHNGERGSVFSASDFKSEDPGFDRRAGQGEWQCNCLSESTHPNVCAR